MPKKLPKKKPVKWLLKETNNQPTLVKTSQCCFPRLVNLINHPRFLHWKINYHLIEGWRNGLVFGVRAKFPNLDFLYGQSDSQSILGHPFILTFSSLVKAVLELFCTFSLSLCKNLYFELASVIIHTFVGSFQLTTGGNHNNENTWFPCLEQVLEVTSGSLHSHPAQLFWRRRTRLYWVFKCGKKYSGFRVQTILSIIHQQPTHHSCTLQFVQASPTSAEEWPLHYRGPATTKTGDCVMSLKKSLKVAIFQGTFLFIWSYLDYRFLHVHNISRFFLLFSPICTKNLAESS